MRKTTFILMFFIIASFTVKAQITNNGFETWTSHLSYEDPTGWATMNVACSGPFYSCTKSQDHYPASVGDYSMRIENNIFLTQMTGGWGMSITGGMDYPILPSFLLTGHPTSLCGYYKYTSENNDSLWIAIWLFNDGINIANEEFRAGTASSWTSFTIPFDSYLDADSATIMIAAFRPTNQADGPNGNSVLYVDNLSFDNLISSTPELNSNNNSFHLYPNPASEEITLEYINNDKTSSTLNIYNVVGDLVKTESIENKRQFNIEELSNGTYIVEFISNKKIEKQKLIIQK